VRCTRISVLQVAGAEQRQAPSEGVQLPELTLKRQEETQTGVMVMSMASTVNWKEEGEMGVGRRK
jgi:hypothetical protein